MKIKKSPPLESPEDTKKFHQMALAEETPEAMAANIEATREIVERAQINAVIDELKRRRLAAGLSLLDLELRTGIAKPHLSRLERHPIMPPKIETLGRIARALGCEIEIRVVGLR
jgi:hypothetical protein